MNEKTKNKEIFELLFKNITLNKYECKICKKLFLYKLSSGYTNPMSHIRTHDNWEEVFLSLKGNNVEDNQTLDKYILKSVSDEAQLIYRWLTYIVMRNQPFSICEDYWTQQFAQIKSVLNYKKMNRMWIYFMYESFSMVYSSFYIISLLISYFSSCCKIPRV